LAVKKFIKLTILTLIVAAVWVRCSPNRNNPINAAYHDFTAHFNAHFLANERIDEVEQSLHDNFEWNYNEILPIYPPFDSTDAVSYKEQLEDAIKKASIAIQRHPGSKFEHPSYILIGKARMYGLEFVEAIEAFKYVNTKSDNDDVRHEALINLMRTYTLNKEYKNAQAVVDYLAKEELNKKNQSLYHLNQAFLYQQTEDLNKMVQNLAKAEELGAHNRNRSRTQFIIGQVYQQLDFDGLAFDYYKRLLKNNPSYELSFYTKLNMAQVTELTEGKDVKTIRKYFSKLLRDRKNFEYLDKIYYEMGIFEQKNGNLDVAIQNFKTSVRKSTNNNRQKGLSYLSLAKIHYDSLREFEIAKSYYDSTVNTLPKDEENYLAIKERQEVLTEFVKHMTTVRENDSLLALSRLPQDSLQKWAQEIVTQDSIKTAQIKAEEAKRAQEKQRQQQRTLNDRESTELISTGTGTTWYFDNPNRVNKGFTAFQRKWNERPLTDNWRRSERSDISLEETSSEEESEEVVAENTESSVEAESSESKVASIIAKVPKTEDEFKRLKTEIRDALYALGKIYNFQLQEPENAVRTFMELLTRFPQNQYEAEVLYQLYLIQKELDPPSSQRAATQLLNDYPESIYAKLVNNPNYREESFAVTQKLKKIYRQAYDLHESGQFEASVHLLDSALQQHPENEFSDNLVILKILNIGEISGEDEYQFELNRFMQTYSESELLPYARKLIRSAESFQTRRYSSSKANYLNDLSGVHHMVLVYPKTADNSKIATDMMKEFTQSNEGLRFGNLAQIRNLPSKEKAGRLLTSFKETLQPAKQFVGQKHYIFIITNQNFDKLYKTKDLTSYLSFYERNYQ